ncbi:MAG: CRISPR-associated protein Csh1 [Candidatus Argoarchaeum ethanivorans]|uniref:CRISPR-associated protein Csh1 n=1 Tax=Candidatus Argoarchaeum ethanivorans TaxID=2608793 RepID=A0A8B3S3K2_9EURY|nr:MAG: CRISPR-associated protein Csh1 [Candidatus Argoarchaeum ethanivorans]
MIEAIKEIGEYYLKKEGKHLNDPVDIIVEDPASSPAYKHILAVIINKTETGFEFGGVRHEEYTKKKIGQYLYKRGSSKGSDLTPTSRITEVQKTFTNKMLLWFKNVVKNKDLELNEEDTEFISDLGGCVEQNKDIILSELKSKTGNFAKNENGILTLIINNGENKYVGDIPVFRKILLHDFSMKLYHSPTYKIQSISQNQFCSVCKQRSDEVYGLVSTYSFYNVDKPGFVAGGFNREDAWKNYPVCLKCALTLEAGKQYVDEFLAYKFYGFNYYIIPKLLQHGRGQEIYELLEDYRKNIRDANVKIKKEYGNLLSETEEEALYILAQQENFLNNNLLFYEKTNAAFRILLYIEDILPSRLRTLFDEKRNVDKKTVFKEFGKDGKALAFTFGNVWHFFPRNREQDMSKYFLEIINKIFVGRKIDYPFLMSVMVNKIRREFTNSGTTKLSTLMGLQLLDYLNNLDLLDNLNGCVEMNENGINQIFGGDDAPLNEKVNKLFTEFPDFFDQPAKRAVFMEGALAKLLLNIQYQERGADPFRTKLQGLKLDERLVKRLLPEMQNKLEEYGKNYYRELEALISKYMIQAGEGWRLSKDEISFYFVLGMNLYYMFNSTNGGKTDE